MLEVRIYTEDGWGTVVYHENTKELMVTHPDVAVREKVRKYLKTEKTFTIPLSNNEDVLEHRLVSAMPTQDIQHLEMALCEMMARTGVWVDWSNPFVDEEIHTEVQRVESMDGEGYDIIN